MRHISHCHISRTIAWQALCFESGLYQLYIFACGASCGVQLTPRRARGAECGEGGRAGRTRRARAAARTTRIHRNHSTDLITNRGVKAFATFLKRTKTHLLPGPCSGAAALRGAWGGPAAFRAALEQPWGGLRAALELPWDGLRAALERP